MATNSSPDSGLSVGVLGSARLTGDDPRCVTAREVGGALAGQGWTVVTGGYGGLMAEVSRGAADAGGRVVGLPMRGWTALVPNEWTTEHRWSDGYPERLGHLLDCDAIVALDGGVGTLAETTVVWSALQTEPAAPPVVAVGPAWRALLAAIAENLIVGPEDLAHVALVDHPSEVAAAIRAGRAARRAVQPRG
ncbi:LOG family protein [Streptomyces sp. NPDC088261]|uniref:LOG family protein n=1 Tax=Streptomyces sp. NPDC088261 TaxID=3365851 RepID=UPI0037FAFB68